jgi:hypothetical protein
VNGDTSSECKFEAHDICPFGKCECICHDGPDILGDAREWDMAEMAALRESVA